MAMSDYLCFTAQEANSTITLNQRGTVDWTGSYSTDNKNWSTYTLETKLTLANIGDKVYFKGTWSEETYGFYLYYTMTGKIAASGNINSLHYESDFATRTKLDYTSEYCNLFNCCTSLTQAPELPAITLIERCYESMFGGCTSLTQAPKLPATTLAYGCYGAMFGGCTSLIQPPELPATTLIERCYNSMFSNCTSLIQAPELPATTLANSCYISMFYGCTSLTQAPKLPATTLAYGCYFYMFYNCTSLTQAPKLPATTLAKFCYDNMFSNCTSLTQPPELPATTLANDCYSSMFYNCTGIKLSTTQTEEYNLPYIIPSSGTGTIGENSLQNMFDSTGGTFTGTPNINTTYYMCIPASSALNIKYGEISIEKVYLGTTEITDFHYGE